MVSQGPKGDIVIEMGNQKLLHAKLIKINLFYL